MYAPLNAQMLGIYNRTKLSLGLRKQWTGEIRRNWNGLRWKLPTSFPARIDCLCYWKCLEKSPLLLFSRLLFSLSRNSEDNIYRQRLFQQRISELESKSLGLLLGNNKRRLRVHGHANGCIKCRGANSHNLINIVLGKLQFDQMMALH